MRILPLVLLALAMSVNIAPAVAMSLEELRAADRLRTQIVVETEEPLYQRAPVVIAVEVATPRWFSRGTRVRDFRIPGAVLRPVSNFADNQSRRVDGETWSVQRWRFRVYGTEAGRLEIPPLRVTISVNTESHGVVDGELQVQAPTLVLERPPGTESLDVWVAASALRVDQVWEGRLEDYETGDALTLVRRYRIEDAPAMVLAGSSPTEVDGMAVYAAPPVVEDQSNRGRLVGLREERFVYTFERSGSYTIPGESVFWFNTTTAQVEEIKLDGLDVTVSGAVAEPATDERKPRSLLPLLAGVAGLAILALLWRLLRNAPLSQRLINPMRARLEERRAHSEYRRAVASEDSQRCVALLYARLDPGMHQQLSAAIGGESLQQLMAHAYGDAPSPPPAAALLELWRAVKARDGAGDESARLTLNPLPSTPLRSG